MADRSVTKFPKGSNFRSAIDVVSHQVLPDVVSHAVFQTVERAGVAGVLQLGHLRLGKVLIICADRFRHIDEFDVYALIQRGTDGPHEIDEGTRETGSQVEDPANLR